MKQSHGIPSLKRRGRCPDSNAYDKSALAIVSVLYLSETGVQV